MVRHSSHVTNIRSQTSCYHGKCAFAHDLLITQKKKKFEIKNENKNQTKRKKDKISQGP
jgi:hypothetical protein